MFSFLFLLILLLLKRPFQPKIRLQKTHTDQNNSGSNFSNFPQLFFSHNESTTSSKSQPNDSERIYFQRHATLKKTKPEEALSLTGAYTETLIFQFAKVQLFFVIARKPKKKLHFQELFQLFNVNNIEQLKQKKIWKIKVTNARFVNTFITLQ